MDFEKLIIAVGCKEELADDWSLPIQNACTKYEISSDEQIAMFLAQIGHESASFAYTAENLNYSSIGLRSVFGRYFPTNEMADDYAHHPEMIASRVYANRLGNSDEASGEGWKYHGRGLIQLTGKDNVRKFSLHYYADERLVDDPTSLEMKELASMSAGWFWWLNSLNQYADKLDIETVTRKINGGLNGLDDRTSRWKTVRVAMQLNPI
jgi:putative chitinase